MMLNMASEEYLFSDNSRDQIARWVVSLRFFRFKRASGGLLNDGDVLKVRLRCTDAATQANLFKQLGVPVDTTLPALIQINGVTVSAVEVPYAIVLMISDVDDPYIVTDAAVTAAQQVEKALLAVADSLIDPPDITINCICPQRYPEFWPPRFEYSWPIKWRYVALLGGTAAFFFLLATFDTELPWVFNAIVALFGLLALAGAGGTLIKTTIVIDSYGDIFLRHSMLAWTLFRRSYRAEDLLQWELKTIPIKVAPGRLPRNTYALILVHQHGTQLVHQDDELSVIEAPATQLSHASNCLLVKTQGTQIPT